MDFRIYKDEVTETSQKNIKECKYEARIYETEEDYNKGEPIQLNVYSDLEYAKKELIDTINFNNYHAGNIINQETGQEVFSI